MRGVSTPFQVVAPFSPTGDQPEAIDRLTTSLRAGTPHVCLLGATGTGKTFTMANVIAHVGKPTLIVSHNKTLAAQLYEELREFLPNNSVNYFVSYYDYYQPEAYIPQRDIYIEKDSSRNEDLDLLRLAATSNILSRRDVVVVASVSCIFGLGSPEAYGDKVLTLTRGDTINRRQLLHTLTTMQYRRIDIEFERGTFRVRGDALEIWPAYERFAVRIELFGDEVERVELVNPTSGEVLAEERQFFLFPAVHHVTPEDQLREICGMIREELDARVLQLRSEGRLLEAQRLLARTKYDLELLEETGICPGVENYSRYMDGRLPGERPYTLMDYFEYSPRASGSQGATGSPTVREGSTGIGSPTVREGSTAIGSPTVREGSSAIGSPTVREGPSETRHGVAGYPGVREATPEPATEWRATRDARARIDGRRGPGDWLLIIDESHVTLPQIRAMFHGDRNRKQVLIEHGFRLPSALDNRPLRFEEFEAIVPQVMFVSATPGPYELGKTSGEIVEQIIRPTGLLDPEIEVKPAQGQVPDLIERCKERAARGERILVTALTKRLCEDLTNYLDEQGLRVRYLHSDIDTLERMEILTDLRTGEFDVLVGVNLLREGLDLPEVSLVCILDADKEGFLRSPTSLIQQMGRAARNINARVVMYADRMTPAMQAAIDETQRRRTIQAAYNAEHGITPATIIKAIRRGLETELRARKTAREAVAESEPAFDAAELMRQLEGEMLESAEALEFERAAALRDQVRMLKTATTDGSLGKKKVKRSEVESAALGGQRSKRAGMPGVRANKRAKKQRRRG